MPIHTVPEWSTIFTKRAIAPGVHAGAAPSSFMPLPSSKLPNGPKITIRRISRFVLKCKALDDVMVLRWSRPVFPAREIPQEQPDDEPFPDHDIIQSFTLQNEPADPPDGNLW